MEARALTSTQNTTQTKRTFRDLGVADDIADALEAEGIVEPFPIQSLALPLALTGTDIIGQARTGTGKTFAFGIPLLQRCQETPGTSKRPRALVVVPTRELAIQVAADLATAGKRTGARIVTVYGGRAYEPQISGLKSGVDVVVGTPGRLLDLEGQGHLVLDGTAALVLDEADKMLDLGFLPDIERILNKVPQERQIMLFSATMPSEIVALSRKYLRRPTHVRAGDDDEPEGRRTGGIDQYVYRTHQMDKPEMLARLLQAEGRGLTMVFCQTKRVCDQVASTLKERGFAAAAVHGDLGQSQRERALRAFRNGKIDVLVATDVAARGLDVDDVTHVVNYECPDDEKTYTHRIGRTGRAGRSGTAVSFIDWREIARWKLINNALGLSFGDPAETYSTSDHFFSDLRIPAGTKGTLAKERRERAGLEAEEVEDIGDTGRPRRDRAEESPRRGRSRNRRRTRGGSGAERPADSPAAAEPTPGDNEAERPRRVRRRRRTRSGVEVRNDQD
ncbi:Superfamily II DNA and RNA helicase [Marinactinospora thermotolerans DSM 45154]|uniref:RNA helicase n=1 Tax=Marinactinospora thermotolerans DSM 45154 TaxID=1122192 RepID=A0A1T4SBM5_9ACTN|nr:DEAD/DEAH box helicase [Marinactinospora thermotolerans]SKA25612.1 Superfamily II DNA and RNA helicase [Marinactinospora thermotolerans DSM 45154]